MSRPNTIEQCRVHLFDDKDKMVESSLPSTLIDRIIRIRSAYMLWLEHPMKRDVEIRNHIMSLSNVNKSAAYEDIQIIKTLLGDLSETSTAFHRFKFNNMIMDSYNLASLKKDTRSMVAAAAQYAKYNKLDKDDPQKLPWDEIIPQRFEPTTDPTVIGIKPIENIQKKIAELKQKYAADIEDIQYEDADLDESNLFQNFLRDE
jgi:hypothetical protein